MRCDYGGTFRDPDRCTRETLPKLTVCAWHATPDAVTLVMRQLDEENNTLLKMMREVLRCLRDLAPKAFDEICVRHKVNSAWLLPIEEE